MIPLWVWFALWYVSGFASFIFWWTKDYDFTSDKLPLALYCGIIGPFAFVLGACLHGEGSVILRKRK